MADSHGCVNRDPAHLEKFTAAECAANRSRSQQESCWNCLHPVDVHGNGQGCLAGLHAKTGTLLSMTGCSCALEPADAAAGGA